MLYAALEGSNCKLIGMKFSYANLGIYGIILNKF